MATKLTELKTKEELEALFQHSHVRPQLIFKHSLTCGISADAYMELQRHLAAVDDKVDYSLIAVQTERELSNIVEAKLGVEHESPQAILIKDEKVLWHKSHRRITAQTLLDAITNS